MLNTIIDILSVVGMVFLGVGYLAIRVWQKHEQKKVCKDD